MFKVKLDVESLDILFSIRNSDFDIKNYFFDKVC